MKPLKPTVLVNDTIDTVKKKILADPGDWFVTILDEQGKINTVIHEECIQRFITAKMIDTEESAKKYYAELLKTPIIEVVDFIRDKF